MSFAPPVGLPVEAQPLVRGDWFVWVYPSAKRNHVKVLAKNMKNKSIGLNTDVPGVEVARFIKNLETGTPMLVSQ